MRQLKSALPRLFVIAIAAFAFGCATPAEESAPTPIEEAAKLLYENRIGCLPVVEADRLVGILTESDLLRALVEVFGAAHPHHAYVFANKRSTRLKVLVHDGIGILDLEVQDQPLGAMPACHRRDGLHVESPPRIHQDRRAGGTRHRSPEPLLENCTGCQKPVPQSPRGDMQPRRLGRTSVLKDRWSFTTHSEWEQIGDSPIPGSPTSSNS